jgi:hypothetical protein
MIVLTGTEGDDPTCFNLERARKTPAPIVYAFDSFCFCDCVCVCARARVCVGVFILSEHDDETTFSDDGERK